MEKWRQVSGLIFGLRIKHPGDHYLNQTRSFIFSKPNLLPLANVVKELPQILTTLSNERQDVRDLKNAAKEARILANWLDTGSTAELAEATSGIAILPLLCLIQITQYLQFLELYKVGHSTLTSHLKRYGGVQGYCGGLPTALAVAVSQDEVDLIQNTAVALRLAFVIGVFGEIGDDRTVQGPTMMVVRLKRVEQGEDLVRELPGTHISAITDPKSITISGPPAILKRLYDHAQEQGLLVQDWPLRGKWHNPENSSLAKDLVVWCANRSNYQYPSGQGISQLARSNKSAEFLKKEGLSEELITSILSSRCEWHSVLCATAKSLGEASPGPSPEGLTHTLVTFGVGDCTPLIGFHEQRLRIVKVDAYKLFCEHTPDLNPEISDIHEPLAESRHTPENHDNGSGIAIVGAACRLPGADNMEELWRILSAGADMHQKLNTSRFDLANSYRASQSANFVTNREFYANLLEDVQSFDNGFFGISSREAANMDPQQRLLLQVAYEAMESSGYLKFHKRERHDPIACFVGASAVDYHENTSSHPPTAYTSTGTIRAFMSGKVSHFFGWTGPSEVIDTACSSSLVAINRAYKAIQGGECTMALAGGVNIMTSPQYFMDLGKAGFLSPSGQCKPFDKNADGYCRSDGVGLVVLKLLKQAQEDEDHILGIIGGVSTNQGGGSASITVPSVSSQVSLYQEVLRQSDMGPNDITYVEAHGTGTPVGDPIEMKSIREVFGNESRSNLVHIGSIKGNLGHCETAAGVAGLLKVLSMMSQRQITRQPNFTDLNPNIPDISQSQLAIPTGTVPWTGKRQAALVTSYGAAGSNSALTVLSPSQVDETLSALTTRELDLSLPLILTANSKTSVQAYVETLASYLSWTTKSPSVSPPALVDILYTLCRKRARQKYGVEFHASNTQDLLDRLNTFKSLDIVELRQPQALVLTLSGQGKPSINLNYQTYSKHVGLSNQIRTLDRIVHDLGYPSLLSSLSEPGPISDPVTLQLGSAVVQLAFARCWQKAGLPIDAVIGHSLGELVALGVCGVLSARDCLALIGFRAGLIKNQWGSDRGAMLVVQGTRDETERLVRDSNNSCIEIACYNSPNSQVLAGPSERIDEIERTIQCRKAGSVITSHRLQVTHAFHSRLVDPILPDLENFTRTLTWNKPQIPLETCHREHFDDMTRYCPSYHARQPVFFDKAVNRLTSDFGSCHFLECGMNSSIVAMIERAVDNRQKHTFQKVSDVKITSNEDCLEVAWSKLRSANFEILPWALLNMPCQQVWLPPYQFDKPTYWLENIDHSARLHHQLEDLAKSKPVMGFESSTKHPSPPPQMVSLVGHQKAESGQRSSLFKIHTSTKRFKKIVEGHKVRYRPMAPAALYLECAAMGLAILEDSSKNECNGGPERRIRFQDVKYQNPLGLDDERNVSLTLCEERNNEWSFSITSAPSVGDPSLVHATGMLKSVTTEHDLSHAARLMASAREKMLTNAEYEKLTSARAYRLFNQVVQYADLYKGMEKITLCDTEAIAKVNLPDGQPGVENSTVRSICDTVTIDIFIQVVGLLINTSNMVSEDEVMVGTGIEGMYLSENCSLDAKEAECVIYAQFQEENSSQAIGDVAIYMPEDRLVGAIFGCRFSKISIKRLEKLLENSNRQSSGLSTSPSQGHQDPINIPTEAVFKGQPATTPKPTDITVEAEISRQADAQVQLDLRSFISSYTGVDSTDILPNATLLDLGVDSLTAREMSSELEERFQIEVDPMVIQDESLQTLLVRSMPDGEAVEITITDSAYLSTGDESSVSSNGSSVSTQSSAPPQRPSHKSILQKLTDVLCDYSGAPKERIIDSAQLSELGIDSLASLELKQEIENIFNVSLNDELLSPDSTVEAIMKKLNPTQSDTTTTVIKDTTPHNGITGFKTSPVVPALLRSRSEDQSPLHDLSSTTVPHPLDSLAANDVYFSEVARKHSFSEYWSQVADDQNKLLVAYLCEAFCRQGTDLSKLEVGVELLGSTGLRYIPRHKRVVDRFLEILTRHGILLKTSGEYSRGREAVPSDSAEELHEIFVKRHPAYKCEADLMALTGRKLALCLEGKVDGMDCLFGNAKAWASMESFYHDAPLLSTATEQLVNFLVDYLDTARSKQMRPVEILEVGAGTGGTTRRLALALLKKNISVRYTFTDISPSLIRRAKRTFAEYDWMDFQVFDLEKTPPSQLEGRFDIVLGTNTIHATSDRIAVLQRLHETLNNTGFAIISETTHVLDWCDLVFGLLDGWWLAEGGNAYPLQPADVWMSYFEKAGYKARGFSRGSSLESETQQLLLACKTDVLGQPRLTTTVANTAPKDKGQWSIFTTVYKRCDGLDIDADVYVPRVTSEKKMATALLIHGGGCFTLSKRSIRPKQISFLLSQGILPVSVNYRLCPQTDVLHGAMEDIRDAYLWLQNSLPELLQASHNVRIDSTQTVVIGYSTGGHLALTMSWILNGCPVHAPKAILSFYGPTIFKEGALKVPQSTKIPHRRMSWTDIFSSLSSKPIIGHDATAGKSANPETSGLAWLRSQDPRSELVFSIFTERTGLALLCNKIPCGEDFVSSSGIDVVDLLANPPQEIVEAICPLAQLEQGNYNSPTFLVHGSADEIAPYDDAKRFFEAMKRAGVDCGMLKLEGLGHLYDVHLEIGSKAWQEQVLPALQFAVERIRMKP